MKIKLGTLFFIHSKNPPVFDDVTPIRYTVPPKVGEAFLFGRDDGLQQCNLSTVQKIRKLDDCMLIKTRNSMYLLQTLED